MRIGADFNSNDFTKEQAFEKFITKKKSFNLAKKTISGYTFAWDTFLKFEKHFKKYLKLEDFNEDLLTQYRLYLIENTQANEVTRATYIKNLRTILRSFMEDGLIKIFKVEIPKYSTTVQETYTISELNKLLKKPSIKKNQFNFVDYRTWVMICYIIDTTNRADTVLNLKINDISFEDNKITLRRVKSKRPYKTPMSNFMKNIFLEYLAIRKGEPDDYVFCTYIGDTLKYEGFRSAFVRYARARSIQKTSIHNLRHTAAKLFILKGGREFALMELLGHTDLQMSKHYVKLFSDDLNLGFNEKCGLSNFKDIIVEKKKIRLD